MKRIAYFLWMSLTLLSCTQNPTHSDSGLSDSSSRDKKEHSSEEQVKNSSLFEDIKHHAFSDPEKQDTFKLK